MPPAGRRPAPASSRRDRYAASSAAARAAEVHHADPPREDDDALVGLCHACHARITAANAIAARLRPVGRRAPPAAGAVQGWRRHPGRRVVLASGQASQRRAVAPPRRGCGATRRGCGASRPRRVGRNPDPRGAQHEHSCRARARLSKRVLAAARKSAHERAPAPVRRCAARRLPRTAVRGRPRVYCGDRCRWRAGHLAALERARETRRARAAEWAGLAPVEQLAALAAELGSAGPGRADPCPSPR